MTFLDLSDDELLHKLRTLGHLSEVAAARLVAERDDPKRAAAIEILLDPNEPED